MFFQLRNEILAPNQRTIEACNTGSLYLNCWITIVARNEEANMFRGGFRLSNAIMHTRIYSDLLDTRERFVSTQGLCANATNMRLSTFYLSHLLDKLPPIGTRIAAFSCAMLKLTLEE